MRFTKMNGAGNDFLILDNLREKIPMTRLPELARTLCDRRRSIGADGLMVVDRSESADFAMRFYNSDGSAGEMCGNGARCICRYGYERGYSGERVVLETTAGIVTGQRIDRRNYRIRLNDPCHLRLDEKLTVDGKAYAVSYVELGDPGIPHAVVEMPGLAAQDERALFELGRKLRYHPAFPKGANVNFYEITGPDEVLEKTYERGVEDFTLACGTGTGSVVTVLWKKGLVSGQNVRVRMAGGLLTINIEEKDGNVQNLYLTGPTNLVAEGEILDEELGNMMEGST